MAEIHIVRLFCRIDKIFCRYDNFLSRLQNFLPNPQVGLKRQASRIKFINGTTCKFNVYENNTSVNFRLKFTEVLKKYTMKRVDNIRQDKDCRSVE